MKRGRFLLLAGFLSLAPISPAPAADSVPSESGGGLRDEVTNALTGGTIALDVLYRLELVEQDNDLRDATALNLRTRLGYRTGSLRGFAAFLELEDVRDGGADSFNSTTNGKDDRSVVADPEDAELNQGYLEYTGFAGTTLIGGRQRIKLDNDRFVGNVGWRLNEQTYDGVLVSNRSVPRTTLTYVYVDNVNRVFGDDSPMGDFRMNSHLLNAALDLNGALEAVPLPAIVGYAYLLDFDDAPTLSSRTLGVRVTGSAEVTPVTLLYTGEYADQTELADGSGDIDASYWLGEGGLSLFGVTAKAGYEVLGGNGTLGFSTPLATLHAFQGWADLFLVTPPDGVEDLYFSVGAVPYGVKLLAVVHDFSAERGGADYGSEIDLLAERTFGQYLSAGVKYARFESDGFAVDTEKIWAWLGLRF